MMFFETALRLSADANGGRVSRAKVRIFSFQLLELAKENVVLAIRKSR